MSKKKQPVPGIASRNSRYMRRHPKEEKIIPARAKNQQINEVFLDQRDKRH